MNKFCLVFIFFQFQSSYAQVDKAFIHHLSVNNLKVEYLEYLNNVNTSEDTLAYYYSKYHFQFGNDSMFLFYTDRSKELLKKDTTLLIHYSKSFLNPLLVNSNSWFNSVIDTSLLVNDQMRQLHLVYNLTEYPIKSPILPYQLQKDYDLFYKATKKSPLMAGIFSAILPGLGMAYLNKPRASIGNFAIVGGFGYQTYESYKIFGLKHPLTIINGAFFTGFYLVNIIGSYLEVKKNLSERKKQYLIHATTYYSDTYPSSLY